MSPIMEFWVPHDNYISGLSTLARRLAEALAQEGVATETRFINPQKLPGVTKDPILLVGLPESTASAQNILDAAGAKRSGLILLLWERIGYSFDTLCMDIEIPTHLRILVPRCADIDLLPPQHRARASILPSPIPDQFFSVAERRVYSGPPLGPAVFIGRLSRSKGAPLLARTWERDVYQATGRQLLMLGKGLVGSDAEREVAEIAERGPAVICDFLSSETDRCETLSRAPLAAFVGSADYYPQALLECVAAGVPTVVRNIAAYMPAGSLGSSLLIDRDSDIAPSCVRLITDERKGDIAPLNASRALFKTHGVRQSARALLSVAYN